MGSRVYAPGIGRFLSIDPTPGGNAGVYDYCTADPINCTDLTGNWPDWGAVLNVVAVVAETVATIVPGPIGTAAGFISAGAYLATGNTSKATEMAITATAQLVGAGLAAKAAIKAVQYASKIGRAVTGAVKSARAAMAESRVGRATERILSKGCNCFVAGTLVDTDHGPVPIETIREGDQVWTRDLDTDTNELHDVVGLFHKQTTALLTITITDGTAVVVTEDHPFYVAGEGWILSGDLRVGDHLAQRNHTTTTITTITRHQRTVTVYNFEVTTTHNYYITTAQLLVHNCPVRAAINKARDYVRDGNPYLRVGKSQGKGEFRISWGNVYKKWQKTSGVERAVTRLHGHVSARYGGVDWHTSNKSYNWTWWKNG